METINLLKQLTGIPAVSGFEEELGASALLASFFPFLNPQIDNTGNVIYTLGQGKRKILIEAHMDEVGFIKTKKGFVKVGYIGEDNIKDKDIELSKRLEDIAYFKRKFTVKGFIVKSPALDNKSGCAALVLALEKLKEMNASVYFVFTTQEETTKKGIKEVVKKLKPDIIISVDSAYAQPFENKRWQIPELGNGPAFQKQGKGFIIRQEDILFLERLAKKNNISYQFEIVDSGEGDTNLTGIDSAIKMFQINIPVRYQHTALSEVDIRDIENTAKMILALVKELTK